MNKIIKRIGTFIKNPYFQMFVAVVLIVSSIQEGFESDPEEATGFKLRVFHGMLLLGIAHFLRTLPDIVEGVEKASEAVETKLADTVKAAETNVEDAIKAIEEAIEELKQKMK